MASAGASNCERRTGVLVPTFRSSYTISAIAFYELRKAMGTSKFMILVPLFDLKSLGSFRRLRCRDFKSAALAKGQEGRVPDEVSAKYRQHDHIIGVANASFENGILQLEFEPAGGADTAFGGKGAPEHRATIRQPFVSELTSDQFRDREHAV